MQTRRKEQLTGGTLGAVWAVCRGRIEYCGQTKGILLGSKTEKPDEYRAKQMFNRITSIELISNEDGQPSQVDYVSKEPNLDTALEVSRYTEGIQKGLWKGFKSSNTLFYVPYLRRHWLVSTDGAVRQDKFNDEVPPALYTLERLGLSTFNEMQHCWFNEVRELQLALQIFEANSVRFAQSAPEMYSFSEVDPRNIGVSSGINWSYGWPDESLTLLEKYIGDTEDNKSKLASTGKQDRHLWLWVDEFTLKSVLNAFSDKESRLPSRKPVLPEEITHVWIVNELNGYGWYFSPNGGWQVVLEEAS